MNRQVLALQQEHQRIFLKEQLILILSRLKRLVGTHVMVLRARFIHWTKPLTSSLPLETLTDLGRSKSELVAENALLRQQLIILKRQATKNRLWGAERIRGELLKLDIHVCKPTIQKYMRPVRTYQPRGQKWAIFVRNHAADIWACDFLQITDLFFRPLFAFFIIELTL